MPPTGIPLLEAGAIQNHREVQRDTLALARRPAFKLEECADGVCTCLDGELMVHEDERLHEGLRCGGYVIRSP
jgi:hypothetical protein